jgi:hypothetical protein
MRVFLLAASVMAAFVGTMALTTTKAGAVVCARGVYRAGCAGPNGAAVVRRPVVAPPPVRVCKSVLVNGVYVRRCY